MDKDSQLFVDLAISLAAADTVPNETQTCPRCQGTLHISVELFKWPNSELKWSMNMHCEDCGATLAFDGITPSPSWNPDKS
jgi:hypothetical protein